MTMLTETCSPEFGGASYLIQRQTLSEQNIKTAFTITLCMAALIAVLLFALRHSGGRSEFRRSRGQMINRETKGAWPMTERKTGPMKLQPMAVSATEVTAAQMGRGRSVGPHTLAEEAICSARKSVRRVAGFGVSLGSAPRSLYIASGPDR
jgi:Polysaccharide biosynthesis protein